VVGLFLKLFGSEMDITGEKWWQNLLMPPTILQISISKIPTMFDYNHSEKGESDGMKERLPLWLQVLPNNLIPESAPHHEPKAIWRPLCVIHSHMEDRLLAPAPWKVSRRVAYESGIIEDK
jgi:hypothetical protein